MSSRKAIPKKSLLQSNVLLRIFGQGFLFKDFGSREFHFLRSNIS